MPKDRKARSVSFERNSLHSPYGRGSSSHEKASPASSDHSAKPAPSDADIKEWEDARCPVCMEHPHNAVLLLCTSNDKGCRPYMCDTSRRHSNCLDQFRKAEADGKSHNLLCPLCRGAVKSWVVVAAARAFMNGKARDCSLESCKFSGAYGELRKHARTEHSTMRPSVVDPERQRDWTRMERQRDIGDLLSTIQPLFVDELGASVLMSPPRFLISLYVRIPQQEDEGAAAELHPRLVISFGPRSSDPSLAPAQGRRRLRPQWGELVGGEMQPSADQVDEEDDDLQGGEGRRAPPLSRRRRRWMTIPDEEDVL